MENARYKLLLSSSASSLLTVFELEPVAKKETKDPQASRAIVFSWC